MVYTPIHHGTLEPAKLADVVVCKTNPLTDIRSRFLLSNLLQILLHLVIDIA